MARERFGKPSLVICTEATTVGGEDEGRRKYPAMIRARAAKATPYQRRLRAPDTAGCARPELKAGRARVSEPAPDISMSRLKA